MSIIVTASLSQGLKKKKNLNQIEDNSNYTAVI